MQRGNLLREEKLFYMRQQQSSQGASRRFVPFSRCAYACVCDSRNLHIYLKCSCYVLSLSICPVAVRVCARPLCVRCMCPLCVSLVCALLRCQPPSQEYV